MYVDIALSITHILLFKPKPKYNDLYYNFSGDLWLSNVLFRYATHPDTGETIPVEVKFIDFQSARFASLATDLILFLFTSVQVKNIHRAEYL